MTEEEWLACDELETILEFALNRMTSRKSRLLAAAFCRYVLPLTTDPCCQRAIDIAERYADSFGNVEEMSTISEQVAEVYLNLRNPSPVNTEAPLTFKLESIAIQAHRFLTRNTEDFLSSVLRCTSLATIRWAMLRAGPDEPVEPHSILMKWQGSFIRDVVGNPFRPVTLDPRWLTSTVLDLARLIYDERQFERMPILADALMDAGCDSEEIIQHCQGPGPHVRGCWVVDLLTGRT